MNEAEWKIVLDHQWLIHHILLKCRIRKDSSDYEELVSIGLYSLIKSVATYKPEKNVKISTYAAKIIKNDIAMYFRNKQDTISINEVIYTNEKGEEITLEDRIEAPDSYFPEKVEGKEMAIVVAEVILNGLSSSQKIIMLYRMADINQYEIAEVLGCNQSHISRLEKKALANIMRKVSKYTSLKKKIAVNITEGMFEITFGEEYVREYNRKIDKALQKLKNDKTLSPFKVKANDKQVIVRMSKESENFIFLAKLFYEIDEKG